MLTSNTIEAKTGIIEITDTSYGSVKSFLEFLHLGVTEKLDEYVEELYVLADMYCVNPLKVRNL
jgi:hypothetical protein